MDDTITPKRRGRPKGERPARTSAEKMKEARARAEAAITATDGDIRALPDTLLLVALGVAYRKGHSVSFMEGIRELTARLNGRVSAAYRIRLDAGLEQYSDTVTAIEADSQTAGNSRHSDQNNDGITDTVTAIESDTVSDIPAPFTLASAAPTELLSARDAEILALHAAGVPLRQIARQFGYKSDNSIRYIIKQHGDRP